MTHSQPQGFLAVPSTGTGPGVSVLHAWWGLNPRLPEAFCHFVSPISIIIRNKRERG